MNNKKVVIENSEHSAVIKCPEKGTIKCQGRRMAVVMPIEYKNYIFNITVQNKENVSNYLSDSGFTVMMLNPQYTLFMLLLRYLCFFISATVLVLYLVQLKQIRWGDLTIESKLVLMLGVLIMFYNDPFYAITLLIPNKGSIFFSAFFTTNTIIALVFFWLLIYQVFKWSYFREWSMRMRIRKELI